jgi:hypothetical protein
MTVDLDAIEREYTALTSTQFSNDLETAKVLDAVPDLIDRVRELESGLRFYEEHGNWERAYVTDDYGYRQFQSAVEGDLGKRARRALSGEPAPHHVHCWHGAGRVEDHPNYALGCCHCGLIRDRLSLQQATEALAAQTLPWIGTGEPPHGPHYPDNVIFPP